MNLKEHLLQTLQEECAEVIQAASKINRFGEKGTYPDGTGNIEKLEQEYNDLIAVVELLKENTDIRIYEDIRLITLKKAKVMLHCEVAKNNNALV
ncbi:MAG: hypothetical protein PHS33_08830 [Candidatus Omnitrophica bacterium]|nr:hypothetical protein [Candidatus Omnitrophota bacterium]